MNFLRRRHLLPGILLLLSSCLALGLRPQSHAPSKNAVFPILLVSDVHLDPFLDPYKAVKLAASPVSGWASILSAPDSANRASAYAAVSKQCGDSHDTTYTLWRSSLDAMHRTEPHARFIVLTGDFTVHNYACRYAAELAKTDTTPREFLHKLIAYVLQSLHKDYPDVPIYATLGNNDSACEHYQFDEHDALYTALADEIAATLPVTEREHVKHEFSSDGYYSLPLTGLDHTRLIVLNDTILSVHYTTCSGAHSQQTVERQMAWLKATLDDARAHHERVWIAGHIPFGVDSYATLGSLVKNAALSLSTFCTKPETKGTIVPYLASNDLAVLLAQYADIIRLGIFGHTHADELRYIPAGQDGASGIPVKIVGSITTFTGTLPSFTVAEINPTSAQMQDYSIYVSSNATGVRANWTREYDFNSEFGQKGFTPQALKSVTDHIVANPDDRRSRDYLSFFLRTHGAHSASQLPGIGLLWPKFACTLANSSIDDYARCACTSPN